jgi:hypothetical protein
MLLKGVVTATLVRVLYIRTAAASIVKIADTRDAACNISE